jgi:hypothetical protein
MSNAPGSFAPFTLRAIMCTPFIAQGHLTLDALLMAILGRGDVGDLIKCEADLYFASSAIPVEPTGTQHAAFVASMRPDRTPEWLEVIRPNTRGGTDLSIGSSRQREAGNITNAYKAVVCQAVEWHATGDMQAVLDAVRDVRFIGKRRSSGYGEVERWEAEPGELDGLVGFLGEPLRPIPYERWKDGGDYPAIEAAWRAPYWNPANRTKCIAPPLGAVA